MSGVSKIEDNKLANKTEYYIYYNNIYQDGSSKKTYSPITGSDFFGKIYILQLPVFTLRLLFVSVNCNASLKTSLKTIHTATVQN